MDQDERAGALLNLTRCTGLRTEPSDGSGFRIVAVDSLSDLGRVEVVADGLMEESAERLMWELAEVRLRT